MKNDLNSIFKNENMAENIHSQNIKKFENLSYDIKEEEFLLIKPILGAHI
jgi:hypothetical protein